MTGSEDAGMTTAGEDTESEYMTEDEEDPTDRYDAARWLRKRVGVVVARDLPAEPSEEDFRQGLRSGMVLCIVLNKIRSGSVPKIVNAPSALFYTPDSTAQAAYFENVKNFLTAIEEMGLPTFEQTDLEPGGDFSSVVDCILAMKAYSESGASDFTWTPRPSRSRKTFLRNNSAPAMNAFARSQGVSINELLADQFGDGDDLEEECDTGPLYTIVSDLLEDREEEDIPIIVENILNKVKEEFASRLGVTTNDEQGLAAIESPISQPKPLTEEEIKKLEEEKAAREQERINKEKELRAQQKAKKEEEERIKKEKELLAQQEKARKEEEERIQREKELLAQQEKARKEEEERIQREKELLAQQEKARKEEEERIQREKELLAQQEKARKEEEERIQREKELLAQQEKARKEEEERIRREKELLRQQEKARRKEEKRIKREKELRAQKAQARKEKIERLKREKELLIQQAKEKKLEEQRIRREKRELEKQEKARRREEERIKRENLSLAQKEKAREEQERIRQEIELLALQEKAKEEEIAAIELEGINREKELLLEEEKANKEEEEQERIEREKEEERARKKDEYRKRMDEYNKLHVNTPKQRELIGQQDNELQNLRSTLSTAKTDVRSMQDNCQEEADNLGKHVDTLCQAAAGYKKVLEENRKLYNQVQDLKGSIRVYCRVRPSLPGQENQVTSVDYMDEETVTIIVPSKSGKEGRKASMFNKVFGPSATQEEVFSDTQPLIRSVLDGFNVCIFACGQTGAGKTYTLTGPAELTPETTGVTYRALNDLFLISEERKNLMNYEISINMIEIYNDEIWDLLISQPAKKGINLPDANLVPVSSTDDVMNLMNLCKKNRAANDRSNRAHTFLTAHVFGKDLTSGTATRGCMHLVDLAGNEKLENSDDEATHINQSLSALGDVLVALANKSSKVNYKNCKLTQLLQDALGAQAKILMFVHVHPDMDEALETLNTFKFAERFSALDKSTEVKDLKEQICLLKSALAKKEAGDPGWQDMISSPRGGDQNGGFEDEDDAKGKNPGSKQPAKSAPAKKAAAAPAKSGKPAAAADPKKKKGK
uniref:Putative calponin-like domain-containing protein n=1 Tax=Helianthus annuus TaxID=4232 RepID=A0A251VP51_HELAN